MNTIFASLASGIAREAQVEKSVELARKVQEAAQSKAHAPRKGATVVNACSADEPRQFKTRRPCTE